jgi:hypothetical protein
MDSPHNVATLLYIIQSNSAIMKHLLTFSLIFILMSTGCRKNKNEPQLPPITTTGEMTFGCKINGKVFVPKDARGKVGFFVQYANLDGGWHLNMPAMNWVPNPPDGVIIQSDSLLIEEGMTYEFKLNANYKRIKGSVYAVCDFGGETFAKLESDMGELHVIRHDQQNRILSGTFFFTGTNISTGKKVTVTDGRFDLRY